MRTRWEREQIAKAAEQNGEAPDTCPECGGELECHKGMVGEDILVCPKHGIIWEDAADAISKVI